MIRSLFARTALILAVVFLLFQAMATLVVYRTVIKPVAERSADDLAALIVLSAQTWVELPPEVRPSFERELAERHGLRLQAATVALRPPAAAFPFRNEIEQALTKRLNTEILLEGGEESHTAWVVMAIGGRQLPVSWASLPCWWDSRSSWTLMPPRTWMPRKKTATAWKPISASSSAP